MPNHVTHICTVTGSPADVARFVEKHIVPVPEKTDKRWFDFSTVIHRPAVLDETISPHRQGHEQNRKAFAETGFTNWYDWACEKWGTKWGAYDFEERTRGDDHYVFKFETAWSFPTPIFEKLHELYPELTFDLASYDEGDNFACVGQFGGRNDFRHVDATDKMYERVYGKKPPQYDENGDEIESSAPNAGEADRG